jgi:hypothetical protein
MTVMTGVKASYELTQYAIAIKQQGIDFAIRHYSHHAGRSLSLAEARALTEAGIQIGVVWDATELRPGHFSRAQGCADGAAAYLMAQSVIAQPSGSAIYFAAACKTDDAALNDAVMRYFEGVNQAFHAAAAGERHYQVGVAGPAACCAAIVAGGLASVSWLTDGGAQDYAGYNLRQLQAASLRVDDGQRISVDMACNSADRPAGLFRVL